MKAPFKTEYDRIKPLLWTHDFGVHPRVSLVSQIHKVTHPDFQREVLFVWDEINQLDGSTEAQIRDFVKRYPVEMVSALVLFGDPAGTTRNTTTGDADWAMLIRDPRLAVYKGFVNKRGSHSAIVDRTDALNVKFCNALGEIGIVIHPRCERLIHDLEVTRYKMGTRDIDHGSDTKGWQMSHWSDALTYQVQQLWPITTHKTGVVGRGWTQR